MGMVPYSVRSDQLFCELVGSHRPRIGFLDLDFGQGSFNHSIFGRKSERVLWAEVAGLSWASSMRCRVRRAGPARNRTLPWLPTMCFEWRV